MLKHLTWSPMNTKSTIGELVIYAKTINIKSNEHQVINRRPLIICKPTEYLFNNIMPIVIPVC